MSSTHIEMTAEVSAYLRDVSLREEPVLRELREITAADPRAGMQITPERGQFMALLIGLTGARRVLEIGVFTGYSSLAVALALPADGRIVACDISEEWTSIARQFWEKAGVAHKIDLRLAPALETLKALEAASEPFDFTFIDADKENYLGYYEYALRLTRQGGLIAIDNVLWHGRPSDLSQTDPDINAIREFNRFVKDDERVSISLLPIGDGLTLARKR